jgi:hypothetical protein
MVEGYVQCSQQANALNISRGASGHSIFVDGQGVMKGPGELDNNRNIRRD